MLKKRKAISLLVAFIFCLSFMAPGFVQPEVASATDYDVIAAPIVQTSSGAANAQDLGVIKVTLDDTNIAAYSILTISMPSDLRFPNNHDLRYQVPSAPLGGVVDVVDTAPSAGSGIYVVAPGDSNNTDALKVADFKDNFPNTQISPTVTYPGSYGYYKITGNNTFDIQLNNPLTTKGADKYFYIYFYGIDLNNLNGDIQVSCLAPSGSAFSTTTDLVIAKSTTTGSTLTTCKKVTNLTDKGGAIDIITVHEQSAKTFKRTDQKVKLEILTKGFKWRSGSSAKLYYGWDFAGLVTNDAVNIATANYDDDILEVTLTDLSSKTKPGKVSFVGLEIEVDDNKANVGDEVEVKVSGGDITKQTFVVAKYVDYGSEVVEGTTKTLVAGKNDQEIGEFYIEEGAPASLVEGRVIKFTLPNGVEWENIGDTEIVGSGSIDLDPKDISGDNNEIAKWEVGAESKNDAVKVKFKDMKVNIAPDFRGDLEIEVTGSAGVEGKIKVAEIKPAATIEVDKVENVILGKPNQKIANITLIEGDVEGFMDDTKDKGKKNSSGNRDTNSDGNKILLALDAGYRFSKAPTVKVVEGDLDIDNEANLAGDNTVLEIEVKNESKKTASKIEISEIYIDAYRTAPEGAVTLKFKKGISAVNETRWDTRSPGKAVIANCVTAALGETLGNGQFVISSNIYEMNGVKKVMDVAPYIKNDRTYVPVRYLGYVLGLTDDNIIWDESSQKVTFTRGDDTVELVIGSTTITVNGEEQVMDVAPEISNDRTMLPARYVAEGFGFNVGWDATTQTVLISN